MPEVFIYAALSSICTVGLALFLILLFVIVVMAVVSAYEVNWALHRMLDDDPWEIKHPSTEQHAGGRK